MNLTRSFHSSATAPALSEFSGLVLFPFLLNSQAHIQPETRDELFIVLIQDSDSPSLLFLVFMEYFLVH